MAIHELVNQLVPFFMSGRKIWVDADIGDDAADGTAQGPYATIARGVQDLRDSYGDILLLRGQVGSLGFSEPPVLINQLSNFAIIGMGNPVVRAPTGVLSNLVVTAVGFVSGNQLNLTVGVGHGYVANQYVLWQGVDQDYPNLCNGIHRILSVTATTIRLTIKGAGLGSGSRPFTGGNLGRVWGMPLAILDCHHVIVTNVHFNSGTGGTDWSGLAIEDCSDLKIVGNRINKASVGFIHEGKPDIATGPATRGVGLVLEGNAIGPLFHTSGHLAIKSQGVGSVYLDGGVDVQVLRNKFQHAYTNGLGGAWTQTKGVIQHQGLNPYYGYLIAYNSWPKGEGDYGIAPTSRMISWPKAQGRDIPAILNVRNFYLDLPSAPAIVDPNSAFEDREPMVFFGEDQFYGRGGLIWDAPREIFGIAGSFGESVMLTSGGLPAGGSGRNAIRDSIVTDATRYKGANLDAAISSRATPLQIVKDGVAFQGAFLDAQLSSIKGTLDASILVVARIPDYTIDPEGWILRVFTRSELPPFVLTENRYALYDQNGERITNAHNPETDASIVIAEQRLVSVT